MSRKGVPAEDLSNVEFETSEDVEVIPSFGAMALKEIDALFGGEQAECVPLTAIQKLQEWGLIAADGEIRCAIGNEPMKLSGRKDCGDGYEWRCRKKHPSANKKRQQACNARQSIRAKTFFERSHLSLRQIVLFSRLWVENLPLNYLKTSLKLSGSTVADWNSFHLEVVIHKMYENHSKIGGEGKTVEIGESKFCRRKYHRGHRVDGQWVFGGVEREGGRSFFVPVEKQDSETLVPIICEWIEPGTTIISDFWKAYDCLEHEGFRHLKVNHSLHFKDPDSGAHANHIEGMWRHAKESLPRYFRRKSYFRGYLAKFMFLQDCKWRKVDLLSEFFKIAVELYDPLRDGLDEDVENETDGSFDLEEE